MLAARRVACRGADAIAGTGAAAARAPCCRAIVCPTPRAATIANAAIAIRAMTSNEVMAAIERAMGANRTHPGDRPQRPGIEHRRRGVKARKGHDAIKAEHIQMPQQAWRGNPILALGYP